MTTKTTTDLMEKLRSQLPKKAAKGKAKRTTGDEPTVPNGGAQRLSITVYPADFKRLNEIKRVMLAEDVRMLTDSVAVRLAVRTVPLDPTQLREAYDAMILEDKRRA